MSKNYNYITGEWEEIPDPLPEDGPSKWWIEGWNAYMDLGLSINPYAHGTIEYWEWNFGYDAAKVD